MLTCCKYFLDYLQPYSTRTTEVKVAKGDFIIYFIKDIFAGDIFI